jgi:DNA mismatch repair protein MutL
MIKILDANTINKIAAGEVIDRPQSIVKELLENSIDANATKITIEIKDGGKKLISVTDNGKGILKEDLKLAPVRYATSKISVIDDIYDVKSLGFRGEALASISYAAKLEIISMVSGYSAYKIIAHEEAVSEPELANHNVGTTIIVKDLFANIPVRLKFLKSAATEFSYIYSIIEHFTLTFPEIDFVLINNNKQVLNTNNIKSQKDLLINYFGKEIKNKLKKISYKKEFISIEGYISNPSYTYSNRSKQFYSINNRLVSSPILFKAINMAYDDLIPKGRFPLILLNIVILQDKFMDVNVHPQKKDIKFLKPNLIFDHVSESLKSGLISNELVLNNSDFENNTYKFHLTIKPEDQYFKENYDKKENPNSYEALDLYSKLDFPGFADNSFEYFQIYDTYIVIKSHEGIFILDQHAVHERILYEKYKESCSKEMNRQVLLIAETVQFTKSDHVIFLENLWVFEKLNFLVEDFGAEQIVIREVPVIFNNARLKELINNIFEQIKSFSISRENVLPIEKLQMMACKAAIKAGQKLSLLEIKALVTDFLKAKNNYTCPHGRPLFIKLDKNDLDKLFLRV